MKQSLQKIKTYIIASILTVISVGTSFLIYFLVKNLANQTFPYYMFLIIFSFLYALLAYISGDIVIFKFKRSSDEINPIIPKEVEERAWIYRAPFVVALVLTLLVLLVFFIISLFMGRWPFL